MPKVRLHPQNIVLEAPRKANLLNFLHGQKIPVGSACGGKGLCASCKVTVLSGAENLSAPSDQEIEIRERNHLARGERLSCQCKILGDIALTTSYW